MHSAIDWNDLRVVLAVAREGSLSAAARDLRVTHSTVFRRLAVIEQALGVRLFERFRDGYAATPAGELAAALADRLGNEIADLERRLLGQDTRPSGTVRIATTDTVWPLVSRHMPAFHAACPEIMAEITISNAMANLTRRDADIAIRPTPEPPEHLIGRRVAGIAHAVYASAEYFVGRNDVSDTDSRDWVWLEDAVAATVIGRWLRRHVRPERVVLTVDALPALRDAACAGLGLAMLPCYLGDLDDRLRRIAVSPEAPRSALWLLTHDDLRRTARVCATMDFLAGALAVERALLEGERPAGAAIG